MVRADDVVDAPARCRPDQAKLEVARGVRREDDAHMGDRHRTTRLTQLQNRRRQPLIILAIAQRIAIEVADFAVPAVLADRACQFG